MIPYGVLVQPFGNMIFDGFAQILYPAAMIGKKSRFDGLGDSGAKVASKEGQGIAELAFQSSPGAGKSRVVKLTGQGSALRAFVARTKAEAPPRPTIKLRAADPSRVRGIARFPGSMVAHPLPQEPEASSAPSERRSFLSSAAQLGEFVRNARLRQRMTQNMLAKRAGTGRRFISELEAGKPTLELERVFQVCNALGLHLLAAEQDVG